MLTSFSVMDQMILYGGVASPPFRAVISEFPWWQPYVDMHAACKSVLLIYDHADPTTTQFWNNSTVTSFQQQVAIM